MVMPLGELYALHPAPPGLKINDAEVGSSNSMIFTLITNARAMATRCIFPPIADSDRHRPCRVSPHERAWRVLEPRLRAVSYRGPCASSVQCIFNTRICGNRLKRWNTIPEYETEIGNASVCLFKVRPMTPKSARLRYVKAADAAQHRALPEPLGPQYHHNRVSTVRLMFFERLHRFIPVPRSSTQ